MWNNVINVSYGAADFLTRLLSSDEWLQMDVSYKRTQHFSSCILNSSHLESIRVMFHGKCVK